MAKKYFLASVGNAEGFKKNGDTMTHVLSARTLTDSSLSFSVSMEEVRAGQGAKLYGRFAHTSTMTIGLTDAMFDMEYLALQTGSEAPTNGASILYSQEVEVSNTGCTLDKNPTCIGTICGLSSKVPVWFTKASEKCESSGEEEKLVVLDGGDACSHTASISAAELLTAFDALPGQDDAPVKYCVSYFTHESAAKFMKVAANFVPSEMILILTAQLFEGDANAPETGKSAGTLVIKVPRYQLDGQFDMSMNMTSAASISLNGVALAVDGGSSCEDKGYYAEIVQYIEGSDWRDNLKEIIVDTDHVSTTDAPRIYGIYGDGSISPLSIADIKNQTVSGGTYNGFRTTADAAYDIQNTWGATTATTGVKYVVVANKNLAAPVSPFTNAIYDTVTIVS